MSRSIKIRVVKESAKTVTIKMLSLNRDMPVPKAEFEKRLESGMYELVPLRTPPPVVEEEPEVEETPEVTENAEVTETAAEATDESAPAEDASVATADDAVATAGSDEEE